MKHNCKKCKQGVIVKPIATGEKYVYCNKLKCKCGKVVVYCNAFEPVGEVKK